MKKIMGSICLALFCLGVTGLEYQIALHFGTMLILFASAAFLGALLVALFRAPEGYEQFDGFHICPRDPRCRRVWVFASPNEPVRRNQRDAARFRSPKSSHARSKVVALGNRTVVTGAGSFPTITRPTLFPSPVIPSPPSIKRRSSSRHDSKVCIGLQTVDSAHKSSTESAATSHKKMPRWPTIAPQLMAACGKLCRIIRDLGSGMVRGNSFKFEKRV
jgi:hypothetical protein